MGHRGILQQSTAPEPEPCLETWGCPYLLLLCSEGEVPPKPTGKEPQQIMCVVTTSQQYFLRQKAKLLK